MGKRVLDFDGYVQNHNNTNESKFGDFLSKAGSAISSGVSRFAKFIKDGIIKIIPSGPKKGTPAANYFSIENGELLFMCYNYYNKLIAVKHKLWFKLTRL